VSLNALAVRGGHAHCVPLVGSGLCKTIRRLFVGFMVVGLGMCLAMVSVWVFLYWAVMVLLLCLSHDSGLYLGESVQH